MNYTKEIANIVNNKFDEALSYHKQYEFKVNLINLRKKYQYICIFGAGALGKLVAKNLSGNGIIFDFFCDNNIL